MLELKKLFFTNLVRSIVTMALMKPNVYNVLSTCLRVAMEAVLITIKFVMELKPVKMAKTKMFKLVEIPSPILVLGFS